MPASVAFSVGGVPASQLDFGTVLPGSSSTARTITLRNTGDVPFLDVRLWLRQDSTDGGAASVTVGAAGLTTTPQSFGPLAPTQSLTLTASWTTAPTARPLAVDLAALRYAVDY